MIKIAALNQRRDRVIRDARQLCNSIHMPLPHSKADSNDVSIAFAGQYSAGKSTILKMLTGQEDIITGAGITTMETHRYRWNGIDIVDTPGIHSKLRPDHDELAYKAIAAADMLVFVVTDELFDSFIGQHFRKLAIDWEKAREMILVVNKMDRAALENTPEQQAIFREDLRKVLTPYTPEEVRLTFLNAEAYLEGLAEREEHPEWAKEDIEKSGYDEFIQTLDDFVKSHGIAAKMTTELYEVDGHLGDVISQLQPKSMDADMDALEESLLQQRRILAEEAWNLRQILNEVYTAKAAEIRQVGVDAANLLEEGCKQEEVEEGLTESVRKAQKAIEQCQREAEHALEEELNKVDRRLNDIELSTFSVDLKARLVEKLPDLPEELGTLLGFAPALQEGGAAIVANASKAGTSGLKLTNFSGTTVHEMVKKIGSFFHFKFKPWQAVKITKGVAVTGKVLGVVGVALSIFGQIHTEAQAAKQRRALRKNRQNIRSQFNKAADELEEQGKHVIKDAVEAKLRPGIGTIDGQIEAIRNARDNGSETCRNLEKLQHDVRALIHEYQAIS